jgi:hypothetical protein
MALDLIGINQQRIALHNCMMNVFKYKMVALTLAGVFAVFNIGLPIVLYACPMMQQSSSTAACCINQSIQRGASIQISTDRSCCKTVYAADRNKTEFLQGKENPVVLHYSTVPLLHSVVDAPPSVLVLLPHYFNTDLPPRFDDIPIAKSSLLI